MLESHGNIIKKEERFPHLEELYLGLMKKNPEGDTSLLLLNPRKHAITCLINKARTESYNGGLRGLKVVDNETKKEWTFLWPDHMWKHQYILQSLGSKYYYHPRYTISNEATFFYEDFQKKEYTTSELNRLMEWVGVSQATE